MDNHSMGIESSSTQDQKSRNRGGAEPKKKIKKLRSIKLSRLPSSKPSTRQPRSRFDQHRIESSDASRNYAKVSSCFDGRKEYIQASPHNSESGLKPGKSLTRVSSLKSKRPLIKKKLKKSSSIKVANSERLRQSPRMPKPQFDKPCVDLSSNASVPHNPSPNTSLNYLKETSCSDLGKADFRASLRNSKSSFDGKDWMKKNSNDSKLSSASSSLKSARNLTRKNTMKPVRILTKMASLKSKRPPVKKGFEVSQTPELSVDRATCSSAIKNSKLPVSVELGPGESDSEELSVMKVCPFTYCSLHGHCHAPKPPLPRFLSRRRCLLKTQKSIKPKSLSPLRLNDSGDVKRGIRDKKMVPIGGTAVNSVVDSASVCDPLEGLEGLTAVGEEKNEVSEADYGSIRGLPPLRDSKLGFTTDVVNEIQLEKRKHISMWRLICQSVNSGIATNVGTQPQLDEVHEEEQGGDAKSRDQEKIDAIKLVQEAFDEILSEIKDHSSDDKSVHGDAYSDQGEGGEQSISTSTGFERAGLREFDKINVKNGTSDPDNTCLKADNITTQEHDRTVPKVGSKSNQQKPKSWSNLKKLILLKRFIKALEKVKKLNLREPRHLPLEPDPEAEKIYLRHQTMEERKSTEEWMLDYALQQVVSQLTPARKRRVQLLVEAFQTVIHPSEIETRQRHNAAVSIQTNPVRAGIDSSVQNGEETGKENNHGNLSALLLGETSYPETSPEVTPELKETNQECCCIEMGLDKPVAQSSDIDRKKEEIVASSHDNGKYNSSLTDDQPNLVNCCLPEVEVPRLCENLSLKPDDSISACHEEFPVVSEVVPEVHGKIISISKSDFCDSDSETKGENLEASEESTATNSVVSLASVCDPLRDSEPDNEFLQKFSPSEDSETNHNTHVANKTQLDKQNYVKIWRMVYQHVVSGSAAKVGSQLHLDRADEEEQVDDANTMHEINTSGSGQDFTETDKDMGMLNHNAGHQKIKLSQIDVIKLVEEAIDEILSPESQDHSSDEQSLTRDLSDQDLSEKNHGEGGELSISTSLDSTKDSFRDFDKIKVENGIISDPEEMQLKVDNISTLEQEEKVPNEEGKSNQQLPRSWSNLKKIILLKRFIKAMEKVRKFNPRKPRYLPLGPDPEAKKIDLRHQTLEERKRAEEWMLDHALQQVVSKLTPARKRRVELLVEAFEAITPLSEIGTPLENNATVSTHAKPIQACD